MFLLSRWVIHNMCDWMEEPLAVSDSIEKLQNHGLAGEPIYTVDSFHGHYPDDVKCNGEGVHYTITDIRSI